MIERIPDRAAPGNGIDGNSAGFIALDSSDQLEIVRQFMFELDIEFVGIAFPLSVDETRRNSEICFETFDVVEASPERQAVFR